MTEAEIYPLIDEHFGSDKYHFGAKQYIRFARAIEQAARATAEQSRDSVIEECCAAIKADDDRMADEDYMLDSNDCINVCRALKSQQDAAIESTDEAWDTGLLGRDERYAEVFAQPVVSDTFFDVQAATLLPDGTVSVHRDAAEQGTPVRRTRGSFPTGALVKLLLDDAFEILRPNSPEDCPEEPWMRVALGKKYWAILTATPRSIESQRSGNV